MALDLIDTNEFIYSNGHKETNGRSKDKWSMKNLDNKQSRESSTSNIHAGSSSSHWTHSPVIAPLYMSTTFENLDPGKSEYEYSRAGNPTRSELHKHLKAIESAEYALAFSSGLGALTTVSYLLRSGDHVICCDDVYGGVNRFFSKAASRMGIETTFVNGITTESWTSNFRMGQTKLAWIETPTNPTMKVIDIKSVSDSLKALDPQIIIVVDNTFMTPVLQSPLLLGADIVMHSVTKYINGHSDVIMGALMTNNKQLFDELKFFQNALGIVPSAFDCSQVIRSIRTLEIRVKEQSKNAAKIAAWLEDHPKIQTVLYPGLKSHPQYEIATKQSNGGYGGIISIYFGDPSGEQAIKLMQNLNIFHLAVSLGCVCSLIQIPSLMTHTAVPESERTLLGINNNLLRLSIGLENPDDLIADLSQALNQVNIDDK